MHAYTYLNACIQVACDDLNGHVVRLKHEYDAERTRTTARMQVCDALIPQQTSLYDTVHTGQREGLFPSLAAVSMHGDYVELATC